MPHYPNAHYTLSLCYLKKGEYKRALEQIKWAIYYEETDKIYTLHSGVIFLLAFLHDESVSNLAELKKIFSVIKDFVSEKTAQHIKDNI